MSKIPFHFIPMPDEFLTDEFIDDPYMMRLIRWIMTRISLTPHTVFINGRKVDLEPFEFIFGREKCAEQTGIPEKKLRIRMDKLRASNLASKTASKTASTFTVYRLMTESFGKNKGQQKGQHSGQHSGHKQDTDIDKDNMFVMSVNACPREDEEKERRENNLQKKELIVMRSHKTQCKVTTVKRQELVEELDKEGYLPEEIDLAIEAMVTQDTILNTTIKKYLIGILQKKRKDRENELYNKKNNTKGKGRFSQHVNKQDPVQRVRESITESTYSWGGPA